MIEKMTTTTGFDHGSGNRVSWGKNSAYDPLGYDLMPGNNGLHRVDTEGLPYSTSVTANNSLQSGGVSNQQFPTEHVSASRQSGSGFTDLFEGASNVQETFV